VNGFIDHLLVIKNDYIKKLTAEVFVDQESRRHYEHKIVFIEKNKSLMQQRMICALSI